MNLTKSYRAKKPWILGSFAILMLTAIVLLLLNAEVDSPTGTARVSTSDHEGDRTSEFSQGAKSFHTGGILARRQDPSDSAATKRVPTKADIDAIREASRQAYQRNRQYEEEQIRREYYAPRLAELGLTSEQSEEALSRMSKVRDTAVINADSLLSLMMQRAQHDHKMREALGEEGYKRYRQFESEKAFHSQVNRQIIPFAKEQGVAISDSVASSLASLLAKHGVTTYETWDGPYDPLPRPGIGVEAAVQLAERNIAQLQNLKQMLSEAHGSLPSDVAAAVEMFFRKELEQAEGTKAHYALPPEERLRREQAVEEERRRSLPFTITEIRTRERN